MSLLGKVLRDKITGLEGVASLRTDQLNGNVRYQIELPAQADGKEGAVVDLDAHRYEVVGEGPITPVPAPEFPHLQLGMKMRDTFSGYVGYVWSRYTSISGCTQFVLTSDKLDFAGRVAEQAFDGFRLEVVQESPKVEAPKTKTGSSLRTSAPGRI